MSVPRFSLRLSAVLGAAALVGACGEAPEPGSMGGGGAGAGAGPGGAGPSSTTSTTSTGPNLGQGGSGGGPPKSPCEQAAQGKTSTGCEFYALQPPIIEDGRGACFAAFLANTSSSPAMIEVSHDGQALDVGAFARIPKGQGNAVTYEPYDPEAGLPPGEVALLFLARNAAGASSSVPDCPSPAALSADASVNGPGYGKAFRIGTTQPVAAYQILPYGGASAAATSATLLLPTSVWGDNYVAVTPYAPSQVVPAARNAVEILAREDGTEVTILGKVQIFGGSELEVPPYGQPGKYALSKGEFVQFMQGPELAGSVIQSNKPVAVFGAASCMNIPTSVQACDTAQQQIPPVRALGSEYVGVRHPDRQGSAETTPWRIVGAADGTALSWEPSTPPGAPTSIGLGDVVDFEAPGPFVVRSQDASHPFYVAAYMTGGQTAGELGDPEWVNVVPSAQYLSEYVLLTDPTYAETSLTVVRRRGESGQFSDVTLGCAGALSGWQPVGGYEFTRVQLVSGSQNVGACSSGRHELSSEAPFGVTVWGWGFFVSYAYPGGAGIEAINDVVAPPVPK